MSIDKLSNINYHKMRMFHHTVRVRVMVKHFTKKSGYL